MTAWKARLKKVIPNSVLQLRQQYLDRKQREEFQRCATATETFSAIYERGLWGQSNDSGERYFSGPGSHGGEVVASYLSAVSGFLRSFGEKLDAVDLGCGDFAVGSQIRPYCGKYIAADVVEQVIERNKEKHGNDSVDFRTLDIINDSLPKGDVVFLRQVLQHLSNGEIAKVVGKLPTLYRFLILTEHLPSSDNFVPNLDKGRGPDTRLTSGNEVSGVVLTEPPFNLKAVKSRVLCEVFADADLKKGILRTSLYEF